MLTSVVADLLDVQPIIFLFDVFHGRAWDGTGLGQGGKAVDSGEASRQNKTCNKNDEIGRRIGYFRSPHRMAH